MDKDWITARNVYKHCKLLENTSQTHEARLKHSTVRHTTNIGALSDTDKNWHTVRHIDQVWYTQQTHIPKLEHSQMNRSRLEHYQTHRQSLVHTQSDTDIPDWNTVRFSSINQDQNTWADTYTMHTSHSKTERPKLEHTIRHINHTWIYLAYNQAHNEFMQSWKHR